MTTTNTSTATKTIRRTAKITSAQPRKYVAIRCDYIAPQTQRIACVAKIDMRIENTNPVLGGVVELKAGEAFWLVRAGSLGLNMFYVVREEVGVKKCSCPANKPCKHEVSLAKHIAEHGRPSIHLRATERKAEASKARAAAIVEASSEVDEAVATEPAEVAQPARELRVVVGGGSYIPQYREGDGAWQRFKDEQGHEVVFLGGYESLAHKFVAVDSDEHRAAVLAELAQAVADSEAYIEKCKAEEARKAAQRQAEPVRDLVAVAAGNAAKAGPAVDEKLIASTASSAKRTSAPLARQGFSMWR